MELTPAQLTTVVNYLKASTDSSIVSALARREDSYLVDWLNSKASPNYIVWKTAVPINEVGKAFIATGLASLTSANNDRLISFALYNEEVEPSRSDQRAFFDDVFSAASGASTRASLLALWKRQARNIEKILTSGAGTDATPATLVFEGEIELTPLSVALNNS